MGPFCAALLPGQGSQTLVEGPSKRCDGWNYIRYWVDQHAGKNFCLVESPSAETASSVHKEAHGLVADEMYPVSEHS